MPARCRCGHVLRGSQFDLLSVAGSVQEIVQIGHEALGVGRETKIGPIQVGVGPRGAQRRSRYSPKAGGSSRR